MLSFFPLDVFGEIWDLIESVSGDFVPNLVGFLFKRLFTYFEILIGPPALYCVDGCCMYSTSFDRLVYCFGVSVPSPSSQPLSKQGQGKSFQFKCGFFVKIPY